MLATADLKAVNDVKLQELEESLVSNLHESIGDLDVESSSLEEEQLHNIDSAMLRLRMLFPQMDIRHVFDGEEGQAGLWETILAIADRGKLGYKEEVKVCRAICGRTRANTSTACGACNENYGLVSLVDGCQGDPGRCRFRASSSKGRKA